MQKIDQYKEAIAAKAQQLPRFDPTKYPAKFSAKHPTEPQTKQMVAGTQANAFHFKVSLKRRIKNWIKRLRFKLQKTAADLYEIPVLGYSAKWCVTLVRLPVRIKQLSETAEQLEQTLALHELRIASKEQSSAQNNNTAAQPETMPAIPASLKHEFYREYEKRFRVDQGALMRHFSYYAPLIENLNFSFSQHNIVDLGCGRGEWLEIWQQKKYPHLGVDFNQEFLKECRDLKINCVDSDALSWMRQASDNSISVLTAFHMIEHISFDALLDLSRHALKKLKPGGMLIFETPNPENVLVGSCHFYNDPTHLRPVPPHLLMFMLDFLGFKQIKVHHFSPMQTPLREQLEKSEASGAASSDGIRNTLSDYLDKTYGYQDYAVSAVKE